MGSGRRGRPPSGRARQVEAVHRRCPSSSGRCCHEDATRPSARLFASPCASGLVSSRRTEPQPLAIAGRASAVTSLSRHCKNAAASQLQAPPRPPLARRRLHAVSQPLVRPLSAFLRRRNLIGGEPPWPNTTGALSLLSLPSLVIFANS